MTRDDVKIGQVYLVDLYREDGMIIPDYTKKFLPKYITIVGFEEGVKYNAFYCIISSNIYHPTETFPIYKKDYPEFQKDISNLDLSIVRVVTIDRILKGKLKTTLVEKDIKDIMCHLAESDYFSDSEKKKYGFI